MPRSERRQEQEKREESLKESLAKAQNKRKLNTILVGATLGDDAVGLRCNQRQRLDQKGAFIVINQASFRLDLVHLQPKKHRLQRRQSERRLRPDFASPMISIHFREQRS